MTAQERHIILVEDSAPLRYVLGKVLESAGYLVHAFPDYRGVLELLGADSPADLLIVDIGLPTGTPHGIAVAAMARQRMANLPVLFVTAYPEFAEHVPAGTKVLLKPVSGDVLLDTVTAILAG
jgi:CheY-like chemotaxis protein